jgi:hypothetical protein
MTSASVRLRYAIGATMDGHGPVEHYRFCRRGFGQGRLLALRCTYRAYWANWR